MKRKLLVLLVCFSLCWWSGCDLFNGESLEGELRIVSGSENKELEDLIKEFAEDHEVEIHMKYLGSVDISQELKKGSAGAYDAVWPANRLWIELGDTQKVVKHVESIMKSPVVLGLKKSVAKHLGWQNHPVSMQEILKAIDNKQFRFGMTSATQSNSGASFYLTALHFMAGDPEYLTASNLEQEDLRKNMKRFLHGVSRSSGSSGWLKDLYLQENLLLDGMINYEALIIEANRVLEKQNREPLCTIYPQEGTFIADSPLGFIAKGDPAKEKLFLALQKYLLSKEIQDIIGERGRRTGLVGSTIKDSNPAVFRKDWCIDTERILASIQVPKEKVIKRAMNMYQTLLRKPSMTAYVLDFSGSMEGQREQNMKMAMRTLLDPDIADEHLLQSSIDDIHIIIPFNALPIDIWQMKGNRKKDLMALFNRINQLPAKGGTDIYSAVVEAYNALEKHQYWEESHFPAVILMSDGQSKGSLVTLMDKLQTSPNARQIPVFSILFGNASEDQLKEVSHRTGGRLFDGKHNLIAAFRKAKGYN